MSSERTIALGSGSGEAADRRLRTVISHARSTCLCLRSKRELEIFFPILVGSFWSIAVVQPDLWGSRRSACFRTWALRIFATMSVAWPIGRKRAAGRKNRGSSPYRVGDFHIISDLLK